MRQTESKLHRKGNEACEVGVRPDKLCQFIGSCRGLPKIEATEGERVISGEREIGGLKIIHVLL